MDDTEQPAEQEEWLTIADVAEMAGVKPKSIIEYRGRRAIPDAEAMFMNHPLWTRKTIEKWVATRKKEAQAKRDAGRERYWATKKEKSVSEHEPPASAEGQGIEGS